MRVLHAHKCPEKATYPAEQTIDSLRIQLAPLASRPASLVARNEERLLYSQARTNVDEMCEMMVNIFHFKKEINHHDFKFTQDLCICRCCFARGEVTLDKTVNVTECETHVPLDVFFLFFFCFLKTAAGFLIEKTQIFTSFWSKADLFYWKRQHAFQTFSL